MSNELILAISEMIFLVGEVFTRNLANYTNQQTAWFCSGDLFDRYDGARF